MKGVYGKESSFGKNDGCKNKGLVNGFGFMESTHVWKCFTSFAEVSSQVDQWFDEHLAYMTINESLCYYNMGIILNDCSYARDVISLSK